MNEVKEIWYKNLDYSMIWACIAGIICVIVFQLIQNKKMRDSDSYVSDYFTLTWENVSFQIIAGFLMLSVVPEIGLPIFKFITKIFGVEIEVDSVEKIAHTLASLCGLFGGYFIAKIINKVLKH